MVQATTLGNCPNCGAPIRGDECPYCGTVFTRKYDGIPLYGPNGNYITTLLEKGLVTRNQARRLCGLSTEGPYDADETSRKLQFL